MDTAVSKGPTRLDFISDERGVSGQALKLAVAVLVAASVFILLTSLAWGTGELNTVDDFGEDLLKASQNVSDELLKHEIT